MATCVALSDRGAVTITLDGSGNGSTPVMFEAQFVGTPDILPQTRLGDPGGFDVTNPSASGFTLTVTGSNAASETIELEWFAMEKSGR